MGELEIAKLDWPKISRPTRGGFTAHPALSNTSHG